MRITNEIIKIFFFYLKTKKEKGIQKLKAFISNTLYIQLMINIKSDKNSYNIILHKILNNVIKVEFVLIALKAIH
jgi:hypothetical protein